MSMFQGGHLDMVLRTQQIQRQLRSISIVDRSDSPLPTNPGRAPFERPLDSANELAARVNDGQEVYVTMQGEKPPSYVGGVPAPGNSSSNTTETLVNINTASAQEMQQKLHISSTSASAIITYRTQHGLFSSVD